MEDCYNVKKLQEDLYQIFMKQDYENEFFDVIFYVDGKELYAHGQTLAAVSPVFKEQLLQNRSNGNQPIQINDFSYDEFFEFIRLIYYDFFRASYNNETVTIYENIFIILELSNIYKAERIKKFCDKCKYFMDLDIDDIEHIFECIEIGHKYSWNHSKFLDTIFNHFSTLIEFDGFINLDKSTVEAFVHYATQNPTDSYRNEKLYETIYKWGEYQAMITVEMPKEEKNQLILHYIKDILPMIKLEFQKLTNKFLFEFAVPKSLISYVEAEKYKLKYVKIRYYQENNSENLYGSFIDDYGIYETFLYFKLQNYHCNFSYMSLKCNDEYECWLIYKTFRYPTKPSKLSKKMKRCEWYLLLEENGRLAVKHQSKIVKTDYLIAEMKSKDEFSIYASNVVY